jgi:hypothetical protein
LRREPGSSQGRERRSGGRQVRKGHRARLGRRARAEQLFVSWTASVAKSALLPARKMNAPSAFTRLIREVLLLLKPTIARLTSGHSGKASQSKSTSRALRTDLGWSQHVHRSAVWFLRAMGCIRWYFSLPTGGRNYSVARRKPIARDRNTSRYSPSVSMTWRMITSECI